MLQYTVSCAETSNLFNYDNYAFIFNSSYLLQAKVEDGKIGKCYGAQENNIKKEWKAFPPRPSTIITQQMIDEDPAAFAAHKLRISDYLLDGTWHSVHNDAGAWTFTDGHSEHPVPQSLMQPMHLRFVELYSISFKKFERRRCICTLASLGCG